MQPAIPAVLIYIRQILARGWRRVSDLSVVAWLFPSWWSWLSAAAMGALPLVFGITSRYPAYTWTPAVLLAALLGLLLVRAVIWVSQAIRAVGSPLNIDFTGSDSRYVVPIKNLYGPTGERFFIDLRNSGFRTIEDVQLVALPSWFTQTILNISRRGASSPYRERTLILADWDALHPNAPERLELFGVDYRVTDDCSPEVTNTVQRFTLELRGRDARAVRKVFEYDPHARPMLKVVK